MKPHLVKIIEDGGTRKRTLTVPKESYRIPLKQSNIDFIKDAMVGVTTEPGATGYRAFLNAGYTVGGKTGTAQVVAIKANEKYNAARLDERLRDNAWFTAFAPADKPKIVLALIVENAGFGGAVAAPIARKVLDYWLLGKRPTEKETTPVPKEDAVTVPVEDLPEADVDAAAERRAQQQGQAGGQAAAAAAPAPAPPPAPQAPAPADQKPTAGPPRKKE
jgi:penicillin-binding protein 2